LLARFVHPGRNGFRAGPIAAGRPFLSAFRRLGKEAGVARAMDFFDIAAIVAALTAFFAYLNQRLWRLPAGTGILALSLAGSLSLLGLNAVRPQWGLQAAAAGFLGRIDFTSALLHGLLCFLLFAGALQVDFERLRANRGTVLTLATVAVLISTALIGLMAHVIFYWFGFDIPLVTCLVLGALISPTDPIAVLALLKRLQAPPDLNAQIAGESLFNDGVGVVLFFALVSVAGLNDGASGAQLSLSPGGIVSFFFWEVGGGVLLGLLFGGLAFAALRSIDSHGVELLITLAMVMLMYSISFPLGVSGPIAVVVAGLVLGSYGRRLAMSKTTAEHIDAFWNMMDEILNAALFLLLGLQALVIHWHLRLLAAGLLLVPTILAARWISVALPIVCLRWSHSFPRGILAILTWGGLRGSLSVAMVLSLPAFPRRDLLVGCTYLVMLFSVLVQGTTMRRLLTFYGIGTEKDAPPKKS
jgi:CPA1 family monovalent cation:H+ antiporter